MCVRVCVNMLRCIFVYGAEVYTSIIYIYPYLHTLMQVVYVSIGQSSPERSLENETFKVV